MKNRLPQSTRFGAVLLVTLCFFVSLAHAQARADRHEGKREVHREHFSTPHWVFDNRFRHNHYYPQLGYSVTSLPVSRVAITFRGTPFFFHAGVWYRRSGPSFVVVRPPVGIIVPVLPPSYAMVWVGVAPYYYANEVFYTQVADGYSVVEPPPGYVEEGDAGSPPPAQAGAPVAGPQPSPGGIWYYCDSAKAYYPYVPECKEGWREVPATPPHG